MTSEQSRAPAGKSGDKPVIHLRDYAPPPRLIDAVRLHISLEPSRATVRSTLSVRAGDGQGGPLALDAEKLSLDSVAIDGVELQSDAYAYESDKLTLHAPPAAAFTLTTVSICDPEANKALSGLYRSRGVYCTQCEAEGFRRIAPYLDRPDVLARFRVRLEADKAEAPVLLSNGNLVEGGDLPGGRHFAVWDDPHPKPAYLFALVGGDLGHIRDEFTTASGRKVELRIYCERGKEERCWWAMDSLKRSMAWDERRFGLEYDLDVFNIVAVSDFNMGAMENKGLNIFNDKLVLAAPETATDEDYERIEAVVAHEYFHNWTGNRVTCRDWFQLCLKEGLTVFRDQEFTSDERSRTVKRIDDVRFLTSRQFQEDAGPLAHPVRPESFVEINNFYTLTVYEKGAELCRMLHTLFGEEGFRKGVDLYFARHDGQAATVEDWLAAMADANGADLSQFARWYSTPGTPEVAARFTYSAATQTARLTLEQKNPKGDGKPLHIPIKLGLVAGGRDLPLKRGGAPVGDLIELRKARQTFVFDGIAERPTPSLLRDFSAPVKLEARQADEQLLQMMRDDPNAFNKWRAAQTLALRLLVRGAKGARSGPVTRRFIAALEAVACDAGLDPAYRAAFLTLPSERDVALAIATDVDPEAVHAARRSLRAKIGRTARAAFHELYAAYAPKRGEPFSPDAASVGARSLRNAALAYLAAGGGKSGLKLAARHYAEAASMTDARAALAVLSGSDGPEAKAAFAHFFERWRDDRLTIDKWFALQAQSTSPGVHDRIKELSAHPLFNLANPNKVRVLYGAFAEGNQARFNDANGQGYAAVAETVMALDDFNAQVAARLAGSFESWRMFEPGRRRLAEVALRRIAEKPGLSADVDEIVSKILS
ncbi:MAG: aminopeptidase N [Hyphomicrobiales bacterium]|nr:aminopeptidase N [Hyphomicrobiales bacterium]